MNKKSNSGKPKIEYGLPKPKELTQKTKKASGVSLGKDKDGFFVYTHRARSKSYKTAAVIPKTTIEQIEETG